MHPGWLELPSCNRLYLGYSKLWDCCPTSPLWLSSVLKEQGRNPWEKNSRLFTEWQHVTKQKKKAWKAGHACHPQRESSLMLTALVSRFAQPLPFPCGIINSQAGRCLTGISAPGSPTLGHRCPACAGGGGPSPGEGSPDDAGVSRHAPTFPFFIGQGGRR